MWDKLFLKGGRGAIGSSLLLHILYVFSGAIVISSISIQRSYADNIQDVQYQERTYLSDTEQPNEQPEKFEESIIVNGKNYFLENVSYETISKDRKPNESENIKIVVSEPFINSEEEHVPESEIQEEGKTYYLKDYEILDTKIDAREIPVSDVITYKEISADSEIPKVAPLNLTDDITGKEIQVQVPLKDVTYDNEHWSSKFEFPITVTNYKAEVFDLNGQEIHLSEQAPLKGYELELLNMIGVSEENYRIHDIKWDGEAYQKNGIWYRKIKATGEMKVVDCHATYSGMASMSDVQAKQIQAVYSDSSVTKEEGNYIYTIKATAKYSLDTEYLERKSLWEHIIDFIKNPIVAVLLMLLFIVLFLWIIRNKNKSQDKFLMDIYDTIDEGEEDEED